MTKVSATKYGCKIFQFYWKIQLTVIQVLRVNLQFVIIYNPSKIQKRYLGVFIFIEHIRKLTIEFLCLFEVQLSNTFSILPFQWWNTLGVFFLTIDEGLDGVYWLENNDHF